MLSAGRLPSTRSPRARSAPRRTPGADDDPQVRHFLTAEVLLGRWAEPAELVGAALLLTDPASSYLTGVILPVDGGWTAH